MSASNLPNPNGPVHSSRADVEWVAPSTTPARGEKEVELGAKDCLVYGMIPRPLSAQSIRCNKVKSLKNSIRSTLGGPKCSLTEPEFDELLKRLLAEGKIKISGTDVSYAL